MCQHLMPLTDIEGSEDSDEESLLGDNNHSFQVTWRWGWGRLREKVVCYFTVI